MPTPLTHALIPLALGHTVTDRKLPLKFWFLAMLCSVFPDLDVIGFRFGISYGDLFGHRGFFHSLFFAFLLSSTVMLLAFRKPPIFSKKWWLIWLFFFAVSGSHGILDAFTNGGLGIALLSPFDTTRYFFPWRPLVVPSWRIGAYFSLRGKKVLLSELYWIWLPLAFALVIAKVYGRIRLVNHDKRGKAERQNVKLAKNILKWFFVVLLTVLLIGAFFLQAPWKVIALVVVFLLAHTVLPKPGLKWFWAGVGVVVIALVIWVFLPEDDTDWWPYTFDEELAALEAKYAIPDEENAARIYDQILEIPVLDGNEPEFVVRTTPSSISGPWLSKDHPETAAWLQNHETTITKLFEAGQFEECRFPIVAGPIVTDPHTYRLYKMRRWAYLLASSTDNDMGEGRLDLALEKFGVSMRLADHLCQQTSELDVMTGMAAERLAIHALSSSVINVLLTDEQFDFIEQTLNETYHTWSEIIKRVIEYDVVFKKNEFGRFYEVSRRGKIRFSLDPLRQTREAWEERCEEEDVNKDELDEYMETYIGPRLHLTYLERKLLKLEVVLRWFTFPSTPQKAALVVDRYFEELYSMAEHTYDWNSKPEFIPISIFIDHSRNFHKLVEDTTGCHRWLYHNLRDLYLRNQSHRNAVHILAGLKGYHNEHGYWPLALDDIRGMVANGVLIDPISGDEYVYKTVNDGFILYSKGANRIDEGGLYESRWPNEARPDDRLIWPPRSCEPEEENADDEQ